MSEKEVPKLVYHLVWVLLNHAHHWNSNLFKIYTWEQI